MNKRQKDRDAKVGGEILQPYSLFPGPAWEEMDEISFSGQQCVGRDQKAKNSEIKRRFVTGSDSEKTQMVNCHNEDASKQKQVEKEISFSDLHEIFFSAQLN